MSKVNKCFAITLINTNGTFILFQCVIIFKKLMKAFNSVALPVQLYVIFTPGGVDFVGGYTYYKFQ